MRFVSNLKALVRKKLKNVEKYVSAEETNSAEVMLIKGIQKRAFGKEFEFMQSKGTSGKRPVIVNQLNLFLDEKGVIRCRSRLENAPLLEASKTPILLPSKTYFSELVASQAHERVFHDGVGETLSAVRGKYWILRGREIVYPQNGSFQKLGTFLKKNALDFLPRNGETLLFLHHNLNRI